MPTPNLLSIATVTPKLLASAQLASGDTTVYTVPASTATMLKGGTLTNGSAAGVVLSLAVIPSGGAVDGTHKVISGYSLAAGDTLPLADYLANVVMGAGDYVSVNASAGAAVDVMLSGLEMS